MRHAATDINPGGQRLAALAAAALLVLVSLAGCGGDDGDGATTATKSMATALECTPVRGDGGEQPCPEEIVNDPADVTVKTSEGEFTIALDVDASPATTTSFRHLVESGFYDGLTFSRVVPGFVIQGGDPLADDPRHAGTGGPGYYVDEPVPDGTTYRRGTVAMAKSADEPAGRSGSQFFIVSGPDAQLPPDYAYVGQVTAGLDTIAAIEALGVGDGPPRKRVTIDDMEVVGS